MFNFRKAKKSIHDWANDVTADNDRMIEVLSKILVPLSDITKYWKEDPAYIESNKKIIAFTGDLYAFGNITKFLEYYRSKDFQRKIAEYWSLGYSDKESVLKAIQYYGELTNLAIESDKDIKIFMNKLIELDIADQMSYRIKKSIIINNYLTIFYNCKMVNLIRSQNGVYLTLIGKYDNVEVILGKEGIRLKEGEKEAIHYVSNLENLEEYLENKKEALEIEQQIRRG